MQEAARCRFYMVKTQRPAEEFLYPIYWKIATSGRGYEYGPFPSSLPRPLVAAFKKTIPCYGVMLLIILVKLGKMSTAEFFSKTNALV
jgi:hypothetical protein